MNAPAPSPQHSIPGKLLRPLPRKRVERFTWQWADTAWVALAAISCYVFTPHSNHLQRLAIGLALSIVSAAAAYTAGLKMHSRVAGVAAAALVATSPNFSALCAIHPVSGAVACAAIVAVASYGVGWMIVTYCAACLAFILGFNGALIGVVIAVIPVIQRRENANAGLIGFGAFAVLWTIAFHSFHLPTAFRPWSSWREASDLLGLTLLVLWFMVPFYAEATLKGARERWLLALCLVATLALIVFTSTSAIAPQLYDAFPLAMLVIGVALGRLIPLIAGDYPSPQKRYAAAAFAVIVTIALKFALEPQLLLQQTSSPNGIATQAAPHRTK